MYKIKEIVYDKRLEILKDHFSIDKELLQNSCIDLYQVLPLKLLLPYLDNNDNNDKKIWNSLSGNKSLTLDFLEIHIDKPWDWWILSYNINITEDFIEKYINYPWNWNHIIFTKSLSFIKKHNNKIAQYYLNINYNNTLEYIENNLIFYYLTRNPNITLEYIENNIDKNWDWDYLCYSDIITYEFVESHIDKEWNWKSLSSNKNITIENIENNPGLPWDYPSMSGNKNITIEYIEKNLDKVWDWNRLSYTLKIDQYILDSYKDKLNIQALSNNITLTSDIIDKYIDYLCCGWNWHVLSFNKYLTTCEFIESHIDSPWCWTLLSSRLNISLQFIIKHIDKPWSWNTISENINITFEEYLSYKQLPSTLLTFGQDSMNLRLPWTYKIFLNKNIFNINIHDSDYIEEVNKYMAIQKIKRIVREATCNPKYKLARKKINEMFDEII